MLYKEKTLEKFLAIFLAFLLVFNPLVAPFIWAEGEEPPVEEPVVEMEIIEELEGDSTIITGDADSLAEVDTTANTNIDCVPGEVTAPEDPCTPPEVETDCLEGVIISNDNLADVEGDADSTATTGDNEIEGAAGDALIDTGDATTGASLANEVNTNVVVFEEGTEINEVDEAAETEETELTGSDPVTVENNNEGAVQNKADVLADTGKNQTNENEGDATIETGDALAWANLLNFLNTNIVGSDFEILILDLLGGENSEVNLNEIWKAILLKNGSDSLVLADGLGTANLQLLIENLNQAYLENEVNVRAATGENQANGNNNASIDTGDATALANVTNFVNTNILGAKFFLGVINVLGSFEGNLILPRPEYFSSEVSQENLEGNSSPSPVFFVNQNQAEIIDQVEAEAETGNNEEINNQGDELIDTGDAKAVANSFSLVNLNIFRNNWFLLIINNLGNWTGTIFGWLSPSAAEEPNGENQIFQLGLDESAQPEGEDLQIDGDLPLLTFQNQNQATVKNNIQTSALTGQNQANENQGNASIKTGNARSLANLFNFINLNILGGRWFIGLVNILGDWSGNAIFAYPDVTVGLTNGSGQVMVGETTEYTLNYQNQGHDEANNVRVEFELPQGLTFLGDSSGLTPDVSGRIYSWFLGSLGVGEGGSFIIQVQVEPDFSFEEALSFWSRIIPQAHAAENGKEKEIVATASIRTGDPESDLDNNTALVTTVVYLLFSSESLSEDTGVDQKQPILEITAWNNVGEFVYPGDTVSFEITIRNKGEVASYDTYLVQPLYNGVPEDFGVAEFEIGTLEPGKVAHLSFGLTLADNGIFPEGSYYTITQAFGKGPNGNEVSSNEARTDFEVRLKAISSLFEARATGKEGEILGALENECQQIEDILPYVLLLLLSSLWLVDKSKKMFRIQGKS